MIAYVFWYDLHYLAADYMDAFGPDDMSVEDYLQSGQFGFPDADDFVALAGPEPLPCI